MCRVFAYTPRERKCELSEDGQTSKYLWSLMSNVYELTSQLGQYSFNMLDT